jgi:hypothetical protein
MSLTVMSRARASSIICGGTALCAIALPGRAQTSSKIRTATQPIENAAEVYYAQDEGFLPLVCF